MVFCERVGHFQPMYAVVYASVPVRVMKASSGKEKTEERAIILDIAENAGELAGKVNLFLHCPYYTGAIWHCQQENRKNFQPAKMAGPLHPPTPL